MNTQNKDASAAARCISCGKPSETEGHLCTVPYVAGIPHQLCGQLRCPYCYTIPLVLREAIIQIRDRKH